MVDEITPKELEKLYYELESIDKREIEIQKKPATRFSRFCSVM